MDTNVQIQVRKNDHISYSFLHLWACPYAVFLRYDGGLRGATTPWIALGSALHLALENTATDFDLVRAKRDFKTEYNRLITEEDVFVAYPTQKKLELEGYDMLEGYYGGLQAGIISQTPLVVEQEFKIPFTPEISIVGRIDKIEFEDGEYIVIDYKSGKAKPTEWFLRHDLQFTAYAWACYILYGKLPKKLIYHQLRTGLLLETTRTMQDIEDLKRMIQNVLNMRKDGVRYRIFHEKICGQCDFSGEICDDHDLEARIAEGVKKLEAN